MEGGMKKGGKFPFDLIPTQARDERWREFGHHKKQNGSIINVNMTWR